MSLVDITAGIAARKHCNVLVVTASVDSVAFYAPLYEGEISTSFLNTYPLQVFANGLCALINSQCES